MANQDLLYSVLPRPPVAPGSGEFSREVSHIIKEPKVKKSDVHPDPESHQQHQRATQPAPPTTEPSTDEEHAPDEEGARIDLYI